VDVEGGARAPSEAPSSPKSAVSAKSDLPDASVDLSANSTEANASWLSRQLLCYMGRMLSIGAKGALQYNDLGGLYPADDVHAVHDHFQEEWAKEVKHAKAKSAHKGRTVNPSIFMVAGRTVRWRIILLGFTLVTVWAGLQFAPPQLSRLLLQHFSGQDTLSKRDRWLVVCAMLVGPLLGMLFKIKHDVIMWRLGVQLKNAMTAAIYRKSLRLSSSARAAASTGQIVNLMAADAQQLQFIMLQMFPLILAPPQLGIGLWLLHREIGNSMFAGIGFMILMIPLNGVIFARISKLFAKTREVSDTRVKLVNEVLNGIRVIKSYAWEKAFNKKVNDCREVELMWYRRLAYVFAMGLNLIFLLLPQMLQLLVFVVFALDNNDLTPSRVFTAIQLFQILRGPLQALPASVDAIMQARVGLARMRVFLEREELQEDPDDVRSEHPVADGDQKPAISIDNGTFAWGAAEAAPGAEAKTAGEAAGEAKTAGEAGEGGEGGEGGAEAKTADAAAAPATPRAPAGPTLRELNVRIKRGELVALVGRVGSGKSSVVQALLGEMEKKAGRVEVHGRVAYVPQQAWIVFDTLRNNIIFGSPMDRRRYENVLDACALRPDMAVIRGGDLCKIGERGINLSGGQKARVSLARAVYNNADIYYLDDPLAAVDTHVGETLFSKCINGILKDKTRLLVTNQLQYLPHVDKVLVVDGGRLVFQGTYDELQESDIDLSGVVQEEPEEEDDEEGVPGPPGMGRETSTGSTKGRLATLSAEGVALELPPRVRARSASTGSRGRLGTEEFLEMDVMNQEVADQLVDEEERAQGTVSRDVYWYYLRAIGWPITICAGVFGVLQQAMPVVGNFVLAEWSDETASHGFVLSDSRNNEYLGYYSLVMLLGAIFIAIGSVFAAEARVRGGRVLHVELLNTILRAPVAFFDVTPTGRILNRFSKDMNFIDTQLAMMFYWAVVLGCGLLGAFVAIAIATEGLFLIMLFPLLILYYIIYTYIRGTAIDLQRLESVSRSPVFASFSETLSGLSSIRAYRAQTRFAEMNMRMINVNTVPLMAFKRMQSWLSSRLDALGATVTFAIAALGVSKGDLMDPGRLGLALTYSMSITFLLQNCVQVLAHLETLMNAVERIKFYVENTAAEAEEELPTDADLPPGWPAQGKVEFRDYSLRYRDGPLVLRNLSLVIESQKKCGVVGRTGAGKSSMMTGLFRIVEPAEGAILLDGVDIATVGLHTLRSRLGIIPQDPVLFTGTVRYNLDPFNEHSDERVWRVLEHVQLADAIRELPNGIEETVHEGGENFSLGQRQLMCMGRALLRNPRVLVLDEATASVDTRTDELLQRMIRENFAESTTLTIAHRLNTIMDSDYILVLDKGYRAEFDGPAELLRDRNGIFRGMVQATGEEEAEKLKAMARTAAMRKASSKRLKEAVLVSPKADAGAGAGTAEGGDASVTDTATATEAATGADPDKAE